MISPPPQKNNTQTITDKIKSSLNIHKNDSTTLISSVESQKGMLSLLKDVPLRTRRALSLYNVYGDSAMTDISKFVNIC